MRHQRSIRSAGFTLVELLTVIAVLAVLASILLAVFARVREKGRSTVCQSNLRQIGLATQLYIDDHSGLFPLSSDGQLSGIQFWPSNILPYLGSRQVLECPTMKGYFESYALGSHYLFDTFRLNYSSSQEKNPHWLPRRESAIPDPTRVWAVRDTTYTRVAESIDGCGMSQEWPSPHSGGANVLFVDGHVKWLNPGQANTLECSVPRPDMFSP